MNGLLKDKVSLITGADRGIGRETARRFAQEGAILYVTDYKEGSLDDLVDELRLKYSTDITPFRAFIEEVRPKGIDRIAPIGKSMDFALVWDGYDLIREMSRKQSII